MMQASRGSGGAASAPCNGLSTKFK